ncbi:MAG: hypothetical protein CMJ46_00055 [Planctomyces sp.]|nr:hypothetical protein [Planctomyces sp.]
MSALATLHRLLIATAVFCIAGLCPHATFADLYVGAATTKITPPLPVSLTGQMYTRIAETADTDIFASVLAMESRDEGAKDYAIMVSCDLVAIRGGLLEAVREKVTPQLPDIDVQKIVLSATHTHTAPTMIEGRYSLPDEGITRPAEFVDFASTRIADAIVEAWNSRGTGSVAWGLGYAVVGQNRRSVFNDGRAAMYGRTSAEDFQGLEGYVEHGMEILFVWNDRDELLATAINISCPAQAVEGQKNLHADFWDPVRRQLREKCGENLHILGWTGAAGDFTPRPMYRKAAQKRMEKLTGQTATETYARRIVTGWEEAYAGAKEDKWTSPLFKHVVKTIELPKQQVSEEERIRIEEEVKALDKPSDLRRRQWKQSVLDRYAAQQAGTEEPYEMELHVIRLGDIVIATNDFELFNEFGLQMKARSPAVQTFVIQLCGAGSYIPTARAYQGGGYSAVIESNDVGPEGGRVLVERTLEEIQSLFTE